MQSAAPELIDLSRETQRRLWKPTAWIGRKTVRSRPRAAAARGSTGAFATNCLLARRLVERGVRFVNLSRLVGPPLEPQH